MKKGEVCSLTCQPEYAYGKKGRPPTIPEDAILVFEIELLYWVNEKVTMDELVSKKILKKGKGKERVGDGGIVDGKDVKELVIIMSKRMTRNINYEFMPSLILTWLFFRSSNEHDWRQGFNPMPVCWWSFKKSKWLPCCYLVVDLFVLLSHFSLLNFLSHDSFSYKTQSSCKPYFRTRFFLWLRAFARNIGIPWDQSWQLSTF